jgi:ribonuclease HI
MMAEMIEIYTDGGCSGNPGPGGWAFVYRQGDEIVSKSGADGATTNNRMELTAVIQALEHVIHTCGAGTSVRLYTDSQYVKNGITVWILNWKRNGWRTASKDPVKNRELWTRLDELKSQLDVSWNWVKGHAGIDLNEMCDSLVRAEMEVIIAKQ